MSSLIENGKCPESGLYKVVVDKNIVAYGPTSTQHKTIALENDLGENGPHNKPLVDFAGFLGVYDDNDVILSGNSQTCAIRKNIQEATVQAAILLSSMLSIKINTKY